VLKVKDGKKFDKVKFGRFYLAGNENENGWIRSWHRRTIDRSIIHRFRYPRKKEWLAIATDQHNSPFILTLIFSGYKKLNQTADNMVYNEFC